MILVNEMIAMFYVNACSSYSMKLLLFDKQYVGIWQ